MTALLKRRTTIGALLITVGLIFVIIGGIWWAHESARVDRESKQTMQEALLGFPAGDPHPQRGQEIVLFVAGGGMALFGMLLIVTGTGARPTEESTDTVRK